MDGFLKDRGTNGPPVSSPELHRAPGAFRSVAPVSLQSWATAGRAELGVTEQGSPELSGRRGGHGVCSLQLGSGWVPRGTDRSDGFLSLGDLDFQESQTLRQQKERGLGGERALLEYCFSSALGLPQPLLFPSPCSQTLPL